MTGMIVQAPRRASLWGVADNTGIPQIESAGFTIESNELDWTGFLLLDREGTIQRDLLAAKYPMSWFVLQEDPSDFQLANFQIAAASTWNIFHVADPTVEELVTRLQNGDEEAGAELNRYVVEQAWFAPFYRNQNSKAVDGNTSVVMQAGNTWPYLWNIQPK
jgi:peptide/nickel transport system substrate-binding protein